MRAYPETISIEIQCASSSHWNTLPDKPFAKTCKIRINSIDILDSGNEKLNEFISESIHPIALDPILRRTCSFSDYLSTLLIPTSLNELMESSDVVGNIRFSHPTLYVFPGGQGDAALFGINGFNMLGESY